jgi:long-chain acyl-CoA synthetase
VNYCDALFGVPEEWRANEALIDSDSTRRYTYGQLQLAVRRLSAFLRREGFRPGDVVATHLYNSAEAVITHLAVQHAGCVTCLLDPLLPAGALGYYVSDTRARCLVSHAAGALPPGALPAEIRLLGPADIIREAEERRAPAAVSPPHDFAPDDVAAIFYTSGTTSQPKGVMLTPRSFFSHVRIFSRACYRYDPGDRLLCFVPFSHGYGSKSIFLPCLQDGAAVVMMRSFQPVRIAEVAVRERLTHIFGVPAHFQQLLRREEFFGPLRQLKAAFSAAALLKLETAREWKERVGFALDEGYGLIETCTGVAFRLGTVPDRLGNVGTYPDDLVSVEIADEHLRLLPRGERGEIVVRGESVMKGYLNRPEETARALQEGWFRTGDMGYKTAANEIVLVGRIKDVINVAGVKVAPFEVEAALNEHPAVNESAVLGVEDAMYGEVVTAFVKPRHGAVPDERELIQFLQKRLMNFQVPKSIVVVEDFPRTTIGKIDKKALRAARGLKRPVV